MKDFRRGRRFGYIVGPALAALLTLSACATGGSAQTSAPTQAAAPTAAAVATPTSAPASQAAPSPAATAAPAQGAEESYTVMVRDDPKLGKILTDGMGKTLYRYTKDSANTSVCTGGCLQAWPALTSNDAPTLDDGIAGKLDLMTRSDGTKQVTYNGMPLYYYAKDTKPGDTTGQGVGSVWYVVTPGAAY